MRKMISEATRLARAGNKQRKAEFDAQHRRGMLALEKHDYATANDATLRERAIIDEQARVIDDFSDLTRKRGSKKKMR